MNNIMIIGNLTRDIDLTYAPTQIAVARFSLAISRGKDKDGNDRGADFPNIVVFGKQAENCEKFLSKGKKVAIQGHLQTGSYEKDGRKIYTTDVIADRVEFIDWGEKKKEESQELPEGFQAMKDDDLPF